MLVTDFPYYMRDDFKASDSLNDSCLHLKKLVLDKLEKADKNTFADLKDVNSELYHAFKAGMSMAQPNYARENVDYDLFISYFLMPLISKNSPGVDDYINSAKDFGLLNELNINPNRYGLIKLTKPLQLCKHALIVNDDVMIYPHQFLRRFYSSNFVDILTILQGCNDWGFKVWLRIDPFRKTTPEYYRDLREADYWHGKPFSGQLLNDREAEPYTAVHNVPLQGQEFQDLTYPLRYTTFITSMMEESTGLRQFSIAEYIPSPTAYTGSRLYGAGNQYIIQKLGHFVFDQRQQSFEHIDGSVRYFTHEQYEKLFQTVVSGKIVPMKEGESKNRIKLFKVAGALPLKIVQSIMYQFFMYNPHIEEYFQGVTEKNK